MSEKGLRGKVIGIIRSPRQGFNDIEEGDLWKGALIILLIATLAAISGMAYASKIEVNLSRPSQGTPHGPGMFGGPGGQGIDVDPQTMKDSLVTLWGLANGMGTITRWLFPSLLVILAAKILVGGGSARRMLAMTGFASIPFVVQQVLRLIDAQRITPLELATLMASRAAATNLVTKILSQTLNVLHIFGIMTLVLTVYAVSTNYETTVRKASSVTLAAYAVYILLKVFLPI